MVHVPAHSVPLSLDEIRVYIILSDFRRQRRYSRQETEIGGGKLSDVTPSGSIMQSQKFQTKGISFSSKRKRTDKLSEGRLPIWKTQKRNPKN